MLRQSDSIRTAVSLMDQFELFFGEIENQVDFKKSKELRIRKPDLVEDSVALPLVKLHRQLLDCADDQEDESVKLELQDYARRLEAIKLEISDFLSQGDETMVYWVEKTGKAGQDLQLCAAPIDVAPRLQKILFRPDHTAVFTSATLSVGKGLSYFQNRVGGMDAASLQLSSPFDYAKQMKVFVPKVMPEPTETFEYENSLARWIKHFTEMTSGKALVLFTSYKTLKSLTEKLRPYFIQKRIQLFSQADPIPRHQLLQDFREDTDSVLFGTDSFWQGVDVPGESLSNVIITRLPFQVPDHPLIEAKLEHIRSRGGDPFREYSLPEAILKFRQGIGRLIRSQNDTGIVAILDHRIISKPYGKSFLSILPECPVQIVDKP
jgi:ATP-dependent DNA helicase DinG